MDKTFFERKVKELSDEKLQDLLRLRHEANREIIDLAIDEAKKRQLDLLRFQLQRRRKLLNPKT